MSLRDALGLSRLPDTLPARLAAPPTPVVPAGTPEETTILAADGSRIPALLLRPDPRTATGAGVVLIAGHGRGIEDLVRTDPADDYHRSLARRIAATGATVLCPEMESFGARRTPAAPGSPAYAPEDSSCRIDAPRHLMEGTTSMGRRVLDAAAAHDALSGLPGIDAARVAVAGGSGGGAVSLLLAALREEVAAALVATYFCTFEASILSIPHCPCNIIPGLWAADDPAERLEMEDLAQLIAPRPLILEAGEADPIFPLAATREAASHLPPAWQVLGAVPPQLVVTGAGHRFVAEESLDLLAAALGPLRSGA